MVKVIDIQTVNAYIGINDQRNLFLVIISGDTQSRIETGGAYIDQTRPVRKLAFGFLQFSTGILGLVNEVITREGLGFSAF